MLNKHLPLHIVNPYDFRRLCLSSDDFKTSLISQYSRRLSPKFQNHTVLDERAPQYTKKTRCIRQTTFTEGFLTEAFIVSFSNLQQEEHFSINPSSTDLKMSSVSSSITKGRAATYVRMSQELLHDEIVVYFSR
jgi:hypothetical protein